MDLVESMEAVIEENVDSLRKRDRKRERRREYYRLQNKMCVCG